MPLLVQCFHDAVGSREIPAAAWRGQGNVGSPKARLLERMGGRSISKRRGVGGDGIENDGCQPEPVMVVSYGARQREKSFEKAARVWAQSCESVVVVKRWARGKS